MVRRIGRVLSHAGGRYRVASDGETLSASLRGRIKENETRVLVGDEVTLDVESASGAVISGVLPRRSALLRRTPGRMRGTRGVAANIDLVVVVGAATQPDWEAPLIDRFLAVVEASDLPVLLVINKCDLVPVVEDVAGPYTSAGYEVLCASAVTGQGLDVLAERLRGRTSLFTGPTGVGKSSLLNRLQPGMKLRTGAVSTRTRAGRHTTVAAEMHPYRDGGYVVDTPGLRDVGLWGLDPVDIGAAFPDITRWAGGCRFDNCRHVQEPDCGVRRAVRDGALSPIRVASYHKLLAEAEQDRY